MKTFIAISSKSKISPYMIEKAKSILTTFYRIDPPNYDLVFSDNGKTAVIIAANEPNQFVTNGKMVAVSSGYIPNCDQRLKGLIESVDPTRYVANTNGTFAICLLNKDSGRMSIYNSFMRMEPVYYSQDKNGVYVANRAVFVNLLANDRTSIEYDISNMGAFASAGYYVSEYTPFKGVNVMPVNSEIQLKNGKMRMNSIDNAEELIGTKKNPTSADYYDLAQALIDSTAGIDTTAQISLALTGGKDSRLLAAVFSAAGYPIETFTNGFETFPDVIVAQRVARQLGLPHTVNIPQTFNDEKSKVSFVLADMFAPSLEKIFQSEGMISVYENLGPPYRPNTVVNNKRISIGGNGGAILKGGFAKVYKECNEADFAKFKSTFCWGCENLFLPNQQKVFYDQLSEYLESNRSYADIMDRFYFKLRNGRWGASGNSATIVPRKVVKPFFDSVFAKKCMMIDIDLRKNDMANYQILKHINPALTEVPFAEDRWGFEMDGPIDGNMAAWRLREPVLGHKFGTSGFNWREAVFTYLKDEMYSKIFAPEASMIFELIDREKLQELFDTPAKQKLHPGKVVWNIYTIALMLSHDWWNGKIPSSEPIRVQIPTDKVTYAENEHLKFESKNCNVEYSSDKRSFTISRMLGTYEQVKNPMAYMFGVATTKAPSEKKFPEAYVGTYKRVRVFGTAELPEGLKPRIVFFQYNKDGEKIGMDTYTVRRAEVASLFNILPDAVSFRVAIRVGQETFEPITFKDLGIFFV